MNTDRVNFHYFYFSTYFLIIFVAFIISFIIFYKMLKGKNDKLDIICVFTINILGFAIGAKLFNLIDKCQQITMINFINSGYGFIGGLLGSSILVYIYCKKYKLNYINIQTYFTIIYPLIYSISKIGCFLNGCCNGIIYNFPLQLLETVLMFILFLFLLYCSKIKNNYLSIANFLILFGIIRFIIDYFRATRNIVLFNFTLNQLCCCISVIIGLILVGLKSHNSKFV